MLEDACSEIFHLLELYHCAYRMCDLQGVIYYPIKLVLFNVSYKKKTNSIMLHNEGDTILTGILGLEGLLISSKDVFLVTVSLL